MGWYAGEWVAGPCEDAPCCGCCGPSGDDRPEDRHEDDGWCWYESDEDDYDEDEDNDYWQAEDSALESSLFGDC